MTSATTKVKWSPSIFILTQRFYLLLSNKIFDHIKVSMFSSIMKWCSPILTETCRVAVSLINEILEYV